MPYNTKSILIEVHLAKVGFPDVMFWQIHSTSNLDLKAKYESQMPHDGCLIWMFLVVMFYRP